MKGKNYKKLFLAALVMVCLSFSVAFAQEEVNQTATTTENIESVFDLPDAGITPASPFYFLDRMFDWLRVKLTFNPVKKAKVKAEILEERLAELKEIAKEKKVEPEELEELENEIEEELEEMHQEVEEMIKEGLDVFPVLEKLEKFSFKRQKMINDILEDLPEKVKEVVEKSIEKEKKLGEKRLRLLFEEGKKGMISEEEIREILGIRERGLRDLMIEVMKEKGLDFEERAQKMIEEAREEIEDVEEELNEMSPEALEEVKKSVFALLEAAKKHLEMALTAFEEGKFNEAFGHALSALRNAENASHILEGTEKVREFVEEIIEIREEMVEEIMEEVMDHMEEGMEMMEEGLERMEEHMDRKGKERSGLKDEQEKIICTTEYDPVCGEDNKTYSNKCSAERVGVKVKHKGKCEEKGLDIEIPGGIKIEPKMPGGR